MLYNPVIRVFPSVLKYETKPLLTRHGILLSFEIDAINTATYRQVITILSFISLFFINPLLSCLNNSAVMAGAVNKISSWLIYFHHDILLKYDRNFFLLLKTLFYSVLTLFYELFVP